MTFDQFMNEYALSIYFSVFSIVAIVGGISAKIHEYFVELNDEEIQYDLGCVMGVAIFWPFGLVIGSIIGTFWTLNKVLIDIPSGVIIKLVKKYKQKISEAPTTF